MMKLRTRYVIIELAAGYACSMALGKMGWDIAAGLVLIALGIFGAMYYILRTGKLTDFRVLLLLSWLGGEGIAAFKLSNLQSIWTTETWLAFGGFFLCFLVAFELTEKLEVQRRTVKPKKKKFRLERILQDREGMEQRLYQSIWIVCIISMATFLIEVLILKFIPLFDFQDKPTYDLFHVTGLHYFTVSCMFTHSLTLIYFLQNKEAALKKKKPLIWANAISLSIPIMCVSKFQFLLTVMLPIIIFLQMEGDIYKINWKKWFPKIVAAAVVIGMVLAVLVLRRNYQEGYLESIFEMKNPKMPMLFQYVYIYIANNFDNFNCMTMQLPTHAYGMKELFPIFALSGMKFVFPQLVNYPIYTTKAELTTLTIIYDAYYDFGLIGVLVFGMVLGCICSLIHRWSNQRKVPFAQLFYALTAICILLAFFSTWFSNPTIWFWYVISGMLWIYVSGIWKNKLFWRSV